MLVYNKAFFQTSQNFMYHQVMSSSPNYEVIRMAEKFENSHAFETDEFSKVKIQSPRNYPGRIFSKVVRSKYDISFHVNVSSYLNLINSLKRNDLKAIHAHIGMNVVQLLPFAKKHNLLFVVTFHGYDASQALADEKYRNKLPFLFDYEYAVIIVSSQMKNTRNLERWKQKVHVIPCSVNPDEFPERTNKETDKIRILHNSRLTGKKGVRDIIRVLKNLSDVHPEIELYVVRDGEEMSTCETLTQEYKLEDSVMFFGAVSHSEVMQMITTADIFVQNSGVDKNGDREGTPVSLLETMSAKMSVISAYHAGIPEVVNDGGNGLLVSEKTRQALEQALTTLITHPELRNQFGERARETVRKDHTVTHT